MRTRLALGAAGVALALYGVFRLVTQVPLADLIVLVVWLVLAVAIHDGVLSPAVIAIGWLLNRLVPKRARGHVAAALIGGGLVTVIAIPLIYREGSQPPDKAILRQDYTSNLTVLLAAIAAASLALYAGRVVRDHRLDVERAHRTDQDPASERADDSP